MGALCAGLITLVFILPLRGFLVCDKCGRNLTGSASTGRSSKYFYYHCHPGCGVRISAPDANAEFFKMLEKINANEEAIDLYLKEIEQIFRENQLDKSHRAKRIKAEIEKLRH